jgi:hypothetical protein
MNGICYAIIGFLLSENNVTVDNWGFLGIMITVLVVQILPVVEYNDRAKREEANDE